MQTAFWIVVLGGINLVANVKYKVWVNQWTK